jgi:hypothetical protein
MTDLNKMWEALARYQPYADADGHGETWRVMCERRTEDAAEAAAWVAEEAAAATEPADAWAARAARAAREAAAATAHWSNRAIERIEAAIKEREPVPSNIEPTPNVSGQAQKMDAQGVRYDSRTTG